MIDRDKLYIDGAWVPSNGTKTIDVINSTTEEVMGRIPEGTTDDVDKAVAARLAQVTEHLSPSQARKALEGLELLGRAMDLAREARDAEPAGAAARS